MEWTSKFIDKVDEKVKFIIAALQCSVKPLSKPAISVFKLKYKQIKTYN